MYRAILYAANFDPPSYLKEVYIKGLFGGDFRCALKSTEEAKYENAAHILEKEVVSWSELYRALTALQEFVISGRQGNGHEKFQVFNRSISREKEKTVE